VEGGKQKKREENGEGKGRREVGREVREEELEQIRRLAKAGSGPFEALITHRDTITIT